MSLAMPTCATSSLGKGQPDRAIFSKFKAALRKAAARAIDALWTTIGLSRGFLTTRGAAYHNQCRICSPHIVNLVVNALRLPNLTEYGADRLRTELGEDKLRNRMPARKIHKLGRLRRNILMHVFQVRTLGVLDHRVRK